MNLKQSLNINIHDKFIDKNMNNKILAGMIIGIVIVIGAIVFYFTQNLEQPEKLATI